MPAESLHDKNLKISRLLSMHLTPSQCIIPTKLLCQIKKASYQGKLDPSEHLQDEGTS